MCKIHSLCQIQIFKRVLKWKFDMTVKLCKSVITDENSEWIFKSILSKWHKLTTTSKHWLHNTKAKTNKYLQQQQQLRNPNRYVYNFVNENYSRQRRLSKSQNKDKNEIHNNILVENLLDLWVNKIKEWNKNEN